jgi:hypothetical protein
VGRLVRAAREIFRGLRIGAMRRGRVGAMFVGSRARAIVRFGDFAITSTELTQLLYGNVVAHYIDEYLNRPNFVLEMVAQ